MALTTHLRISVLRRWIWLPSVLSLLLISTSASAQTGTITGTVTDAVTGAPIPNVSVAAVTFNGGFAGTGNTDASGAYSVSVPPGAMYFVLARIFPATHVAEFYPDSPCPGTSCSTTDLATATHLSVAAGATISGINLALTPAGSISGTVTNAATGAPVSGMTVFAAFRVGQSTFTTSAGTNAAGQYTLTGLDARTYYLATSANASAGLRNEIFDNVPCVGGCQTSTMFTAGTPTVVASGGAVTGRNFALEPGGSISGTVTNATTGAPLQNVSVSAYSRVGTATVFAGAATTNASGQYTIGGLAAANYVVFTNSPTTNEIYNDILCPITCSSATAGDSGTAVAVTLGATTPGVDIALDPGGSISGTVTNQGTGAPLQFATVVAVVRVGNSTFTRSASSNAAGEYTISGLPTGSYSLYTSVGGFVNEIFDNIPCPAFCSNTTAVTTGTPVPVTTGATTPNRNFALQAAATSGGTLTGTITDAASGLPIAGIGVEIWLRTGSNISFVTSSSTNLSGQYGVSGLVAGSYLVDTAGAHPFRNEVFDNIPCNTATFCSTTTILSGTPVAVSAGAPATANLALNSGDAITGTVTDAATGAPLVGVSVTAINTVTGLNTAVGTSQGNGRYQIRGLVNGSYVLVTSNSLGYFNEIFDNIRCTATCSTATAQASGTRVTITTAGAFAEGGEQLVAGINFALDVRNDAPGAPGSLRVVTSGGTAQFTWTAPSLFLAGAPTSYLLEAGLSPGTTFITLPIPGTGTTFNVPGVPPGTYFVRLRAVNAAGQGPASNEVTLAVGAGGLGLPDPPTSVAAFMSGGLLTLTWASPLAGGPPSGYIVEAGSASGSTNIASLNVAGAAFTFNPVPNGFYFLRVRSRNAAGVSAASPEVMINVGNVPAPSGPPAITSVTVSSGTVTINWSAPTQGTVTSYVIEAGSATGLADLATVNTGSTALTQSFSGVPPGTYYVRIRGVNAQGVSIVSNERVITVS